MANAIISTGGKQFHIAEGDVIQVATLQGESRDKISFDQVLAILGESPKFGSPVVSGAKVEVEIVRQGLGKKIIVFKFRTRKRYKRKSRHRQAFTEVKITSIKG